LLGSLQLLLLLQLLELLLLLCLALQLQELCLLGLLLCLHRLCLLLAAHQVLLCVHLLRVHLGKVAQLCSIVGLLQLLLQQGRLLCCVPKLQALTLLCCLLENLLLQDLLLRSIEAPLSASILQLLELASKPVGCQQLCLPLVAGKLCCCGSIALVEQELVALCTSTAHQGLQVALHQPSIALQACIGQLLLLELLLELLLLNLLLQLLLLLDLLLLLAQSKLSLGLLLNQLLLLLHLLLALQLLLYCHLGLGLLSCLLLLCSLRLQLL
jgi:hypothetical protein